MLHNYMRGDTAIGDPVPPRPRVFGGGGYPYHHHHGFFGGGGGTGVTPSHHDGRNDMICSDMVLYDVIQYHAGKRAFGTCQIASSCHQTGLFSQSTHLSLMGIHGNLCDILSNGMK